MEDPPRDRTTETGHVPCPLPTATFFLEEDPEWNVSMPLRQDGRVNVRELERWFGLERLGWRFGSRLTFLATDGNGYSEQPFEDGNRVPVAPYDVPSSTTTTALSRNPRIRGPPMRHDPASSSRDIGIRYKGDRLYIRPTFDLAGYLEEEKTQAFEDFSGLSCLWRDLSYVVRTEVYTPPETFLQNIFYMIPWIRKKTFVEKEILKKVSGFVEPGMLVLVLGPPGCGKTTLLRLLSSRLHFTSGQVLIGGKPPGPNANRMIGYVAQENLHIPTLTVREVLQFAADCLLPQAQPNRRKRIEVILHTLGLKHVATCVVGDNLIRGISGGEMKRLTLGVEFAKDAAVWMMDEPTSGLDAPAARDIIEIVRTLCQVISMPAIISLLQPGPEIFAKFTHVLLLTKGQTAYFGPRENAVPYFAKLGLPCPDYVNPASFLSEVVGNPSKFADPESDAPTTPEELVRLYEDSEEAEKVTKAINSEPPTIFDEVADIPRYVLSEWGQFKVCFQRAVKVTLRTRANLRARAARAIIMSLMVGLAFINLGTDQRGAQNRLSVIFPVVAQVVFGSMMVIGPVFLERDVLYAQREAKFYRNKAYYLSTLLVEFLVGVSETLVYSLIIYWTIGLNKSDGGTHFWIFLAELGILQQAATSYGTVRLVCTLSPIIEVAGAVAPALLSILVLFSGFLIQEGQIPRPWIWAYWLSPFHYGFESLAINEFRERTFTCSENELIPPLDEPGFEGHQVCPITRGETMLDRFDVVATTRRMWLVVGLSALWWLVMAVATYIAMQSIRQQHRPKQEVTVKHKPLVDRKTWAVEMALLSEEEIPDNESTEGEISSPRRGTLTGAYLSFHHLSYSVAVENESGDKSQKLLLDDVTGFVRPGVLLALMGASGAGKSTLLDVLAGRKTGGTTSGEILVNGNRLDDSFSRFTGYVEQQDIHMSTTTVREAIEFSAMCRLPESMPKERKLTFATGVLRILELEFIADHVIGTHQTGGISVEQRKRLTIGVELAADPKLLFLDEPTTGLDTAGAEMVMKVVKKVSRTGRTVICTIHQPSTSIFRMFDAALLLHRGQVVYNGPVGENFSSLLGYLSTHGLECPKDRNPADFVLEVTGSGIGRSQMFNAPLEYQKSRMAREIDETVSRGIMPQELRAHIPTFDSPYATTLKTQLKQCFKRGFRGFLRRPGFFRSQVTRSLFMAFVVGTLYYQIDNSQEGARLRVSAFFFSLILAAVGSINVLPFIIEDRAVYCRERSSHTYRSVAYLASLVLTGLPFEAFAHTLYVVPFYFLTGLNTSRGGSPFFIYCLVYLLVAFNSQALCQLVGVLSPSLEAAAAIAPTIINLLNFFNGFLLPRKDIPPYFVWIYHISFIRYGLEAATINELDGAEFNCGPDNRDGGVPVLVGDDLRFYCPIREGKDIYEGQYDMVKSHLWPDIGVLLLLWCATLFFVLMAIRYAKLIRR